MARVTRPGSAALVGLLAGALVLPAPARAERPYEGPSSAPTGEQLQAPRVVDPAQPPPAPEVTAPEIAEPEPEPGPEPDFDPLRDSPEAMRARSYVQGGIIVLTTAVALVVGSVVMGTSDPCAKRGGNNCHEDSRNRAALSMGIPGAALLAAGGALLGVGLRQRARLRASLALGRAGAGVTLRLRF